MDEKKIRAEALAERIKLLFTFVFSLKEDKDILEEVVDETNKSADFALNAAPLLGAFGMDYELEHFNASLEGKRAKALLNLINVLIETEKEHEEFKKRQQSIEEGRKKIRSILG